MPPGSTSRCIATAISPRAAPWPKPRRRSPAARWRGPRRCCRQRAPRLSTWRRRVRGWRRCLRARDTLKLDLQPQLSLRASEIGEVEGAWLAVGAASDLLGPGAGEVDLLGDLVVERRPQEQRRTLPRARRQPVEFVEKIRLAADHCIRREAPGERGAGLQFRGARPSGAVEALILRLIGEVEIGVEAAGDR